MSAFRKTPVYPRVRGGTVVWSWQEHVGAGLSPRARGNLDHDICRQHVHRSIPACAGEPRSAALHEPFYTVYPRVRGGTPFAVFSLPVMSGLSPRARGNQFTPKLAQRHVRSIPACAGEPARKRSSNRSSQVYPRVRGGTTACAKVMSSRSGLSPRARGNRHRHDSVAAVVAGLSPRARGNLHDLRFLALEVRSIPACAGEPLQSQFAALSIFQTILSCQRTGQPVR